MDLNNDGTLSASEVGSAFEAVGEKIPGFKLREIITEVDKNKDGKISFDEFLEVRSFVYMTYSCPTAVAGNV